jgi:hypothetical protein
MLQCMLLLGGTDMKPQALSALEARVFPLYSPVKAGENLHPSDSY